MLAALVTTIIVLTILVPVTIVTLAKEADKKEILIPRKRRRKVCPLSWTNNNIEHFIRITMFVISISGNVR